MRTPDVLVVSGSTVVSSCVEVEGSGASVVVLSTAGVCSIEVDTDLVDSSDVLVIGIAFVGASLVVSCGETVDVSGAGVGITKFSGTIRTKKNSVAGFAP